MHFFNVSALAHRLKGHQVPVVEKFFYSCGLIGLLVLRMPMLTLLPILYATTFGTLKTYLEVEAKQASVTLMVFDIQLQTTFFLMFSLLCLGLMYIGVLFFKKARYQLVEDVICLSFPAILRILTISVGLFLIFMVISSCYFIPKLCALSNKATNSSWVMHTIYAIRKLNLFKTIVGSAKRYYAAHQIFDQLSQLSMIAHHLTIFMGYVNIVWFIHILRKNLSYMYGATHDD